MDNELFKATRDEGYLLRSASVEKIQVVDRKKMLNDNNSFKTPKIHITLKKNGIHGYYCL